MKKTIKKILIIILLFTIPSCSSRDIDRGYLSFTLTYQGTNEFNENILLSDIYMYEFESEKATLVATIPYEKDYPLGIYVESKNSVLYSGISDVVSGNQVWMLDLETEEKTMLTRSFYYLAFFQPISDSVVLVGGVLRGADDIAINLFELNIDSLQLLQIDFNDDVDVRHLAYDSDSQSVLFAGYSHDDLRKRIINQDTIPFTIGDNYIFEYKDGTVIELVKEDENEIMAMYRNNNQLQYRTMNLGYLCYDLLLKDKCIPEGTYLSNPYFHPINEEIYYVDDRDLKVYEINNKTTRTVFTSDKPIYTINNMFYIERGYGDE